MSARGHEMRKMFAPVSFLNHLGQRGDVPHVVQGGIGHDVERRLSLLERLHCVQESPTHYDDALVAQSQMLATAVEAGSHTLGSAGIVGKEAPEPINGHAGVVLGALLLTI